MQKQLSAVMTMQSDFIEMFVEKPKTPLGDILKKIDSFRKEVQKAKVVYVRRKVKFDKLEQERKKLEEEMQTDSVSRDGSAPPDEGPIRRPNTANIGSATGKDKFGDSRQVNNLSDKKMANRQNSLRDVGGTPVPMAPSSGFDQPRVPKPQRKGSSSGFAGGGLHTAQRAARRAENSQSRNPEQSPIPEDSAVFPRNSVSAPRSPRQEEEDKERPRCYVSNPKGAGKGSVPAPPVNTWAGRDMRSTSEDRENVNNVKRERSGNSIGREKSGASVGREKSVSVTRENSKSASRGPSRERTAGGRNPSASVSREVSNVTNERSITTESSGTSGVMLPAVTEESTGAGSNPTRREPRKSMLKTTGGVKVADVSQLNIRPTELQLFNYQPPTTTKKATDAGGASKSPSVDRQPRKSFCTFFPFRLNFL